MSHVKMYKFGKKEYADFKISATTETDNILTLIYQSPDINALQFKNDLADITEEQITRSGESVILGDLNIRTNDKSDIDTINPLDLMESFDL